MGIVMRLTHSTTYLRAESGRPWHIATEDPPRLHIRLQRLTLCGRSMRLGFGAEIVDDGSVPEPVCATCRRVAQP